MSVRCTSPRNAACFTRSVPNRFPGLGGGVVERVRFRTLASCTMDIRGPSAIDGSQKAPDFAVSLPANRRPLRFVCRTFQSFGRLRNLSCADGGIIAQVRRCGIDFCETRDFERRAQDLVWDRLPEAKNVFRREMMPNDLPTEIGHAPIILVARQQTDHMEAVVHHEAHAPS